MSFYESRSRQMARGLGGLGFTLAEVLVVVAVITLLVAILMPTLNGAFSAAHNAMCKGNLFHIAQTMHSNTTANANISSGYNWLGVTLANSENSRDLVWCPADVRSRSAFNSGAMMRLLEKFHNLQYNGNSLTDYSCSYLPDILGSSKVHDPQVWAIYPRGGINQPPVPPESPVPTVNENQAYIGMHVHSAVLITFRANSILFESKVPPPRTPLAIAARS